jgi:hypothetical protein
MKDYAPIIRQIIEAPDSWLSFALFGGPRVERVVHNGSIALIGDASHRRSLLLFYHYISGRSRLTSA